MELAEAETEDEHEDCGRVTHPADMRGRGGDKQTPVEDKELIKVTRKEGEERLRDEEHVMITALNVKLLKLSEVSSESLSSAPHGR